MNWAPLVLFRRLPAVPRLLLLSQLALDVGFHPVVPFLAAGPGSSAIAHTPYSRRARAGGALRRRAPGPAGTDRRRRRRPARAPRPADRGRFQVVEVWESREDFERYSAELVGPAATEVLQGRPRRPTVLTPFDVRGLVLPLAGIAV